MSKFLKPNNRALLTLLLGLVIFTACAYYHTAFNEITPIVAARTGVSDRPVTAEALAVTQPQRNLSQEAVIQSTNTQHAENTSNSSEVSQAIKTSESIQILNNSQSNRSNETRIIPNEIAPSEVSVVTTTSTTRSVNYENTARVMYLPGYEVTASNKCPDNGSKIDLVIAITSAPSHSEARTAIRQTWGHYGQRSDVAILFMLGLTRDRKFEKALQNEQRLYGDIIRGRYLDTYSNLTLKTISSLEWVSTYCNRAKFMLKTDDDMFINVPRLLSFVAKHQKEKNVIFGRLARKWKPFRNKKSKYYVSTLAYKPPVFPDFTTGPAYLVSQDVVKKLHTAALDQTYVNLEDVFITGIVAAKLGIRRSHANEFVNTRTAHSACNVQRGISIHMVKYSEQFDLWKKLLDGKSKCK